MSEYTTEDVARFQRIQGSALPRPSRFGATTAGASLENGESPKFNQADSGTANTDFVITHNLGYAPGGYRLLKATVAGSLYDGTAAADATTITLKYSGANANLWIELL